MGCLLQSKRLQIINSSYHLIQKVQEQNELSKNREVKRGRDQLTGSICGGAELKGTKKIHVVQPENQLCSELTA